MEPMRWTTLTHHSYQCKGNGMANQVFKDGNKVLDLPGFMGIGHLRYPTAGTSESSRLFAVQFKIIEWLLMLHNSRRQC